MSERPRSPEELSGIERKRALSDYKKIEKGAKYRIDKDGGAPRLEFTKEQLEEVAFDKMQEKQAENRKKVLDKFKRETQDALKGLIPGKETEGFLLETLGDLESEDNRFFREQVNCAESTRDVYNFDDYLPEGERTPRTPEIMETLRKEAEVLHKEQSVVMDLEYINRLKMDFIKSLLPKEVLENITRWL